MRDLRKVATMILTMLKGERRRISVKVTADGDTGFRLENPTYYLRQGDNEIDTGVPQVTDTTMVVMISPPEAGSYILEFHFSAGGEDLIKRLGILVEK